VNSPDPTSAMTPFIDRVYRSRPVCLLRGADGPARWRRVSLPAPNLL
jgi:hypothetical protein